MTDANRTLIRSAPYFLVADVDKASAYYERVLGFAAEYTAGSPAAFAIQSRDGLAVMLRLASPGVTLVPNEAQRGTWDAFFWTSDVRKLLAELRSRGATLAYDLVYQDAYDMDEFAVRDLDGYVLGFGQARSTPPQPEA
jgi:catechol 2,3-dioxygenase-like lactoylglutathione lyase family enzyme